MFNAISIKNHSTTNPLDIGYLAESLLFYDRTHLYINEESLTELLIKVGEDNIGELVNRGLLDIYTSAGGVLGIGNHSANGPQKISVDVYTATSVDKHWETIYNASITAYEQKRGRSRRTTERLYDVLKTKKYNPGLVDSIKTTMLEPGFSRAIISELFNELGLQKKFIGEQWSFDYFPMNDGYLTFSSNLDLEYLRQTAVDQGMSFDFSPTTLALNVAEAMGDLEIAANNGSEILTNPFYSKIMDAKVNQAFINAKLDREEIAKFQKYVQPTYQNLADVINVGERNFNDLLHLLDKAAKFRDWKSEIVGEEDFIFEYSKALADISWFEKLPGKVGRFLVFNAVSVAAGLSLVPAAGAFAAVGIAAFDSFLLDKLVNKWQPNHFINGDYKKFVKG